MCGRYTLIETDRLQERFLTVNTIDDLKPNYNTAPGQVMPVVVAEGQHNEMKMMKWGLVPSWAKEPKIGYRMINARSEGIESKPSFRHAYKKQRCLVPASGFYEWQKSSDQKIPKYITTNQPLFAFAGLWEHWQPDGSDALETYTIITTQASPAMQPVHDRMPIILQPEAEDDWLNPDNQDPDFLRQIMQRHMQEFDFTTVSQQVNSVKNNSPELIEAVEG